MSVFTAHRANRPCGLLTVSTIKHLIGRSAGAGTSTGGISPGDIACSWDLGAAAGILTLTFEPSITKGDLTAPQSYGELGAGAKHVPGVGSVAYMTCMNQKGAPPLCELRGSGHGKTFDFTLTAPGTQHGLGKILVTLSKLVFSEL
ncbi:MAG TPA: hypothetical protein VND70_04115 [Acidimicrobiales bacterium]|nr:hypothetical protein [Acidimicrobiales bacterium]